MKRVQELKQPSIRSIQDKKEEGTNSTSKLAATPSKDTSKGGGEVQRKSDDINGSETKRLSIKERLLQRMKQMNEENRSKNDGVPQGKNADDNNKEEAPQVKVAEENHKKGTQQGEQPSTADESKEGKERVVLSAAV